MQLQNAPNKLNALKVQYIPKYYTIHAPVQDLNEERSVAHTGNLERALHALQHPVAIAVALRAVRVLGRPEQHAAQGDHAALVGLFQKLVAVLRHL